MTIREVSLALNRTVDLTLEVECQGIEMLGRDEECLASEFPLDVAVDDRVRELGLATIGRVSFPKLVVSPEQIVICTPSSSGLPQLILEDVRS